MNKPSHLMKYFVLLASASMLLAACGGGGAAPAATTAPAAPAATTAPKATEAAAAPTATPIPAATPVPQAAPSKYQEAPMWAAMVKAGTLPPVDQRLPAVPFVVGPGVLQSEKNVPNWTPGKYGGVLHTAHAVANWSPDVFVMLDEPLLKAPDLGTAGTRGNVVEDFKVENNNQDFTFTIRKGLKWSTGDPVTTEDVRFTWEDMYLNEKLYPSGVPSVFRNGFAADGDPAKLTIIDDYTFKIQFTKPYGGFLRNRSRIVAMSFCEPRSW